MVGGSIWVLPSSSTTKTGRHDIAEILLKAALNTIKIKSKLFITFISYSFTDSALYM
jgi:hypothetical protein